MKKHYWIFSICIMLCFTVFGVKTMFFSHKQFSSNENRYLTQLPEISEKGILEGSYQRNLQKALNDQFPYRDQWMKIATEYYTRLGQKDIGNTYLGKDGYLLAKIEQKDINQVQYMKNLRYIDYLGAKHKGKVAVLFVPTPGTVLTDKLPANASMYQSKPMFDAAKSILDQSQFVDIQDQLANKAKHTQVYYRNDHHWTLQGAYEGYRAIAKTFALPEHSYASFEPKAVTKDFLGTMYSRVLTARPKADTIYAPTKINCKRVECDGEVHSGLYDAAKLRGKDRYGYFLGGNYGKVVIQNNNTIHVDKNTGKRRKLLIIKDSFANSLVPFLTQDYDEITMIDLRYYQQSLKSIFQNASDMDILVLYEMSNFAQDKNVFKIVH